MEGPVKIVKIASPPLMLLVRLSTQNNTDLSHISEMFVIYCKLFVKLVC